MFCASSCQLSLKSLHSKTFIGFSEIISADYCLLSGTLPDIYVYRKSIPSPSSTASPVLRHTLPRSLSSQPFRGFVSSPVCLLCSPAMDLQGGSAFRQLTLPRRVLSSNHNDTDITVTPDGQSYRKRKQESLKRQQQNV